MKKALIFYGLLLSAGMLQDINAASWQNPFNRYFNRESLNTILKKGKNFEMLQGMNATSWQNPFNRYFNRESLNTILKQGKNFTQSRATAMGQYAYNDPDTIASGLGLAGLAFMTYYTYKLNTINRIKESYRYNMKKLNNSIKELRSYNDTKELNNSYLKNPTSETIAQLNQLLGYKIQVINTLKNNIKKLTVTGKTLRTRAKDLGIKDSTLNAYHNEMEYLKIFPENNIFEAIENYVIKL